MKALVLALLLSQEQPWGQQFFATEPPPPTLTRVTYRFQDESVDGYFITKAQLHKLDDNMQQCLDDLGDAQVKAAEPSMPKWVWITTGILIGGAVTWTAAGAIR